MDPSVPSVNPESLERVWELYNTVPVFHSIDSELLVQLCEPGDDFRAVVRRVAFYRVLLANPEAAAGLRAQYPERSLLEIAASEPLELRSSSNIAFK